MSPTSSIIKVTAECHADILKLVKKLSEETGGKFRNTDAIHLAVKALLNGH